MKRLLWIGTRLHVWLYRATGGKMGSRVGGVPILLLTTRGRRSGRQRTTPVGYAEDGGRILIAAANVGSDANPEWFWNLRERAEVNVETPRDRYSAVARVVEAEERDRLWSALVLQLPALTTYESRTQRTIPVVVLTRPR